MSSDAAASEHSGLSALNEQQVRELAELVDALLASRLSSMNREWEASLDIKLESKLKPIRTDLAALKHGLKQGLARLT